jgi:hypothetical protein
MVKWNFVGGDAQAVVAVRKKANARPTAVMALDHGTRVPRQWQK